MQIYRCRCRHMTAQACYDSGMKAGDIHVVYAQLGTCLCPCHEAPVTQPPAGAAGGDAVPGRVGNTEEG